MISKDYIQYIRNIPFNDSPIKEPQDVWSWYVIPIFNSYAKFQKDMTHPHVLDRYETREALGWIATLTISSMWMLVAVTGKDIETLKQELIELHERKNAGYSGNDNDPWKNFRMCEKFGIPAYVGCITRLCDKVSRFETVYNNSSLDKVNESAIDTLYDMVAYCGILYHLVKEL